MFWSDNFICEIWWKSVLLSAFILYFDITSYFCMCLTTGTGKDSIQPTVGEDFTAYDYQSKLFQVISKTNLWNCTGKC